MSITKYKALLTTIEYGSLTKAAEELGCTQPGISHIIKALEREFGFPLLNRNKDGVSPTENAQDLLFYLRQIVTGEEKLLESVTKINGLETGTIQIGYFYSISVYWLPSIIKTFEEIYPNIQLQLFVGDYMEINAWLIDGENLIPQIKYRVKGDATILSMVSQGLGVSLMPELFLLRTPEQLVVKPLITKYYRTLGLTIHSLKTATPTVKKFIETTQQIIQ
ncbi:MAG: LysR family transcriptional regulator [Clostridium sp.]